MAALKCPHCRKLLLPGATLCRWCKSELSTSPPGRAESLMDSALGQLHLALAFVLSEGHRQGIPGVAHDVHRSSIVVGGSTLTITPVLEDLRTQAGQHLVAARFEVSCDGTPQPAWTTGTIGNDRKKDAACLSAARHWYFLFGHALIRGSARGATPLALGRYDVYPGSLLLRGTGPGGWVDGSAAMQQKILSGLEEVVRSYPGDVRSIVLQFAVSPTGGLSGDCRINAVRSELLLHAVRGLGWPRSSDGWMLKQNYVLTPTSTTAPRTPAQPQGGSWEESIRRAQELVNVGEFQAAGTKLENQLMDSRGPQGLAEDRFRSIALGLLSQCLFHDGKPGSAVAPARAALEGCEKAGDPEGIAAYRKVLFEIQRYLGNSAEVVPLAEGMAELLDKQGRAAEVRRWRRRASIIKAGEPLCRVVIILGTDTYEVDEAPPPGANGKANFCFERNRISIGGCEIRMRNGRAAGAAGRIEEALAEFQQAASLDPYDPDPHYQSGCALMDLERFADAAEEFRATEERAPGWFHCRRDLWLAEQISLGTISKDVFFVLRMLDANPTPPQKKLSLVEAAIERFPSAGPLHLWHGDLLASLNRRKQAPAAYRRGLEIADEPDLRTGLLVKLSLVSEETEAKQLLQEACCTLGGNLVCAAQAAYTLRMMARNQSG